MTELYINKQLVVLPRSLNMPLIEENAFFTKNGKYTLDITLSLEEDENSKIYQHIERINVIDRIALNRSAVLKVDNEVVLNGTEIITEISNTTVTIQLVSGNSELFFLIGGDQKLRDLDLGKAELYTGVTNTQRTRLIFNDLKKSYPERNWQLLPFAGDEKGKIQIYDYNELLHIGNNYIVTQGNLGDGDGEQIYPVHFGTATTSIPQPYLCFIIEKIIESLGYTLSYNGIAQHPHLKNLYVVHGYNTLYFAKMLPYWTVDEFFTEIEQWLDCVLVVGEFDKTVQLLFNYDVYGDESNQSVDTINIEVLDEYSMEIDKENLLSVQNANIGYSLDSEEYYKYMQLSSEIKEKSSTSNITRSIYTILENAATLWTNMIYPTYDESRFIKYRDGDNQTIKKADAFCMLQNREDSDDVDIEVNIIPAAMRYTYINQFMYGSIGLDYSYWLQIPIAANCDPFREPNGSNNDIDSLPIDIQKIVEGEQNIDSETKYRKMRVAFYSGLQPLDQRSGQNWNLQYMRYPTPYVESLCEYLGTTKNPHYFMDENVNPFRFDYLHREIYSKSKSIDTTKTYKLIFTDPGKIDIMSKFIANNKAFRCAKIERTITIDGFSEIVKGDFYPYNNENK